MFDEIIEMLNSTILEEQMRDTVKAAQEKYKPLHDWRKTHAKKPKT